MLVKVGVGVAAPALDAELDVEERTTAAQPGAFLCARGRTCKREARTENVGIDRRSGRG